MDKEIEQRLADLEQAYAKLRGRHAAITSAMVIVLSGEVSPALLLRRRESLIANTLDSHAPDEFFEGVEEEFAVLTGAAQMAGKIACRT